MRPSDAYMCQKLNQVINNGLSPIRRQAIIWTNGGILIIEPLGTTFSKILIEILVFSLTKNEIESVVYEMAAILSRHQCVKVICTKTKVVMPSFFKIFAIWSYSANWELSWCQLCHHGLGATSDKKMAWWQLGFYLVSLKLKKPKCSTIVQLTYWGRDKMAAIFQTTFLNAFSCKKMFEFWLKFHWRLFPRVQLTIFQHWFR